MTDLERVARAICKSRTCEGFNCCEWPANMGRKAFCAVTKGGYDDAAKSALSVLQQSGWGKVPEGWKIVPIEPTEEMVDAGFNARRNPTMVAYPHAIYRAMISSSPNPTQEG